MTISSVLVVAAAIVDDLARPSRLLAARRTRPAELAGRWELPGGKVEPGEDPVSALHREISEELGVRVRLGGEVAGPVMGAWPISTAALLRVWWAVVDEGRPEPLADHDRLWWLGRHEWLAPSWLPADIPLAARLDELRAAAEVPRPVDGRGGAED